MIFCHGMHGHLREPGLEYKETMRAELVPHSRGFSGVACMANTFTGERLSNHYSLYHRKGARSGTSRRVSNRRSHERFEGAKSSRTSTHGGSSVRAISDDGMPVMNSQLMRKAHGVRATFDIPVISHAEDLNLPAVR